jgi:CubicO group peptidase (beta-lactamase class C family)
MKQPLTRARLTRSLPSLAALWWALGPRRAVAQTAIPASPPPAMPAPGVTPGAEVAPEAEAAPGEDSRYEAADRYLRERMSRARTPGLAVVIVEANHVTFTRGYGAADRESGREMTAVTPVPLATAVQGMTALAVMQLVERGQVSLDAPVRQYLPTFTMLDPRAAEITVRHLLSHRAGIPQSAAFDGAQDSGALARRVASLAQVRLDFPPGSGFRYSNDGFNVAGLVVQTVTGIPYEQYMAEQIFGPLEMTRTTFDPVVAARWAPAQGYAKHRGVLTPAPTVFSGGYNPSAMAISTAADIGTYLIGLLNGGTYRNRRVVGWPSVEEMWTPGVATGEDGGMYGLGCFIVDADGMRFVVHGGDLDTAGSQILLVPERRLGVGVFTNLSGWEKNEFAQDLMRIMLGAEPLPHPTLPDWRSSTFVPDRSVWAVYAGRYETSQGPLEIVQQGEKLVGTIAGQGLEFVPLSDTTFVLLSDFSSIDEMPAAFAVLADGTVALELAGTRFAVKR